MHYDLVTVDVWDTLLRRHCAPDATKLATCRYLWLLLAKQLHSCFTSPYCLLEERRNVEASLGKQSETQGSDQEYIIEDVMNLLLKRILVSPLSDYEELIQALVSFEIQTEKDSSFPDPTIHLLLASYPARRRIFLSDFYMSSAQLTNILDHHGLSSLVSEGLSSAELKLNKRSGRLFEHVLNLWQPDRRFLHIGDNLHSDVSMPRKAGFDSIHYKPTAMSVRAQKLQHQFSDRSALLKSIVDSTSSIGSSDEIINIDSFKLGLKMSPLFIGFSLHIAEQAIINQCESILFFTREGEFFSQVFANLFYSNSYGGHELPPSNIVEVSRLSTFCASLREITTDELMRLWSLYSTQSMQAFSASLQLDLQVLSPLLDLYGIDASTPISYPWKDKRIIALFCDPNFLLHVKQERDSQRDQLKKYLLQSGLKPDASSIMIVDIGWRGSIQDNLSYVYPDLTIHGSYLGLAKYLNYQAPNTQKTAFGPNLNLSHNDSSLLDTVSPIEMLCNSPNGSTIRYVSDGLGGIKADKLIDLSENSAFYTYTSDFQSAVITTTQYWAKAIKIHAISSAELRLVGIKLWRELIQSPPNHLIDIFSSLHHNEQFGVGKFVKMDQTISIAQVLMAVVSVSHRSQLRDYLYQTSWTKSSKNTHLMGLCTRILLSLIDCSARAIRKGRRYLQTVLRP